jgi:threonine dehydratase
VLSGKIDVRGKRVVCLMSGGNIDVSFVSNLIERGLVARGRRLRFSATLIDRPGSLVHMLNAISGAGANILSVEHDKISARLGPNETAVHVVCEVGGKEHAEAVIQKLAESGIIAEQE